MPAQVFGSGATATQLYLAFNGVAPSNPIYNNWVNVIDTSGESALALQIGQATANITSATLAASVLANLGVSAATTNAEAFAALSTAVVQLFDAYPATSRGQIVLNMTKLLTGLEGNATYGTAAANFNSTTLSAYTYASSTANTTPGTPSTGSTFTLTSGVDNIVGTSGNDAINASVTATSAVLGGLDVVDGAGGTDTLNIADTATAANADFALPAGFTVKNVEALSVTTNGAIGTKAGTAFDLSGLTGLTSATLVAAGAGSASGSNVKAADTTGVALTVAGNNQVDIAGGKVVSVVSGATGTGTVGVAGSGLTSVSIKGGGVATVDNTSAAAVSAAGTTMTAVTLDGIAGATAALKGAALDTVTMQNQKTALAATVTNGTSTALTVNVSGVGYDAAGAGVAVSLAAGAKAATLNVNATGSKSAITLTGAAAKTVNITGSAALDLAAVATATKINGSAATGNLTLNTLNAVTVNVATGSGNDKFTADTTSKLTVDSGAGNDIVTLSGALVAGSTVNLGAGNDNLIGTAAALTSLTATSVIDGGDGADSVSAAMVNAGNATLFKNFESLSLNSTTGLDIALLTGNTITGLAIDSATTNATYQNVSTAAGLTVSYVGDNSALTNTLVFSGVTGTADGYTVTFAADNSAATTAPTAANVKAGTIVAAGIENVAVVSGGAKAWNSLTLNDAAARTLTVTGAANVDLAFSTFGTAGTNGVSSIDGSAATGKLSINVAGVGAASAGLTIKGGTAADTLTTSTFATTLVGGAGADSFNVAAAVVGTATPAGAVVTTISDAAATDKIVFANLGTEVFTTTKVDVSSATALIGGTVNALDLAAAAADSTTNGQITWFQYGGNTYVVQELGANAATIGTDDIVVKLTGVLDLSTATYDAATNVLTLV